jgi:hypothetical protein
VYRGAAGRKPRRLRPGRVRDSINRMKNPAEALAAHILDRLAEEGVLLRDDVADALPKFADGKLTAEDWLRYVKRSAPRPAPEEPR